MTKSSTFFQSLEEKISNLSKAVNTFGFICPPAKSVSLLLEGMAGTIHAMDIYKQRENTNSIEEIYIYENKEKFDAFYKKIAAKEIVVTISDQQLENIKNAYGYSENFSGNATFILLERLKAVREAERTLIVLEHMKNMDNWITGFCKYLWLEFKENKGIFENIVDAADNDNSNHPSLKQA